MQPKFKKGDKIRCISQSMAIGIEVGGIYTVSNPMYYDWGYDISIKVEGLNEASPFQSRFELVEETNKPKFNVGDMVETPLGLFEVLDSNEGSFFCYKEGYDGHSGEGYFEDKYVRTEYEGQCWWFKEDELKLVETKEQPKINYREMSPDTLVKVSIDGNEFEVPLGDLVHAEQLLGNSTGMYGYRVWKALNTVVDEDNTLSKNNVYPKNTTTYKLQSDLFKIYFIDKEKEALKKDIETQKYILETQQALLKDLEVKSKSL